MVKDTARFADSGGWGYAQFARRSAADGPKPVLASPAIAIRSSSVRALRKPGIVTFLSAKAISKRSNSSAVHSVMTQPPDLPPMP